MMAAAASLVLSLGALSTAPAPDGVSVRRFTLIAAANDGGPERVRLRYAEADAQTIAGVLKGFGGVAAEDERVLIQPSGADLRSALVTMSEQLRAAQGSAERLELIVYYSGHSDTEGLLLGEERFSYRELKSALDTLPADVRIAILDSCSSGAMTRQKGGVRRPTFTVDAANRVRGYAVLTSSSEDEAAQESDRLGGSFFTHYLVSGLRGAGDLSQDSRVTLNEAYHYAFHETLARTENTLGGAQHPAFDIQLVGNGDVVMTDLRASTAGLTLGEPIYGRLFVRDAEGRLTVELKKVAGRRVELGLEPGTYAVSLLQDGLRFEGRLTLSEGGRVPLEVSALERTEGEATTLRGGGRHPVRRRVVPLDIGVIPYVSLNGPSEPALNHVSLSLGMSYAYDVEGVALAIGGSWLDNDMEGAQMSVGFNRVGRNVEGAQVAVGANLVGASVRGVQAAVGLNITEDGVNGVQSAVAFNHAGGLLEGIQSAVGFNLAQRVMGLQIATGLNLALSGVDGGQVALGMNYASQVDGLQVSSGLNVAGPVEGAQVSLVNVAGEGVGGAQLGLVNVARAVSGLQLGLVNLVERTDGVSLGLLNYATQDGILDMKLSSSDVALAAVALELGTRSLYTAAAFGVGTWEDSEALSFGLHLGGRIYPGPDWEVNLEIGSQGIDTERDINETDLMNSARVTVGYRVAETVLVFLGPTLNVFVDLHDVGEARAGLAPSYSARPRDDRVYLWPGLVAGVQLF